MIKTIVFCLACFFFLQFTLQAQNPFRGGREIKRDADMMRLSKEQAAEMDALKKEWKQETDAIKKDPSLTKLEKKIKINELKEDYRPRRDAIYTPEQLEIMKDYDTGMFGSRNMRHNEAWNERAREKVAADKKARSDKDRKNSTLAEKRQQHKEQRTPRRSPRQKDEEK